MNNDFLLKKLQEINRKNAPKANFPSAPLSIRESINQMPNSEKLSPSERWIYERLPGFSQSTAGQALAKFGESWAGQALGYLDVLAEGVERTVGLFQQIKDDPTFELNKKDIAAGWYAGGLTYDVNNIPSLKRDAEGNIIGISVPSDLPGTAALTEARQQIALAISRGDDPGEALIKARDQYYNGLGALALRAQIHDTLFHIVADPLNFVAGWLKPVQAIKARAISAAGIKVATNLDEIADLERVAKLAGNAEEAAEWARVAQRVQAGELKTLNVVDKAALFLTGYGELAPGKVRQAISKIPILNMFELTPESKARELITVLDDNLNAHVVARVFNDPQGEKLFLDAVQRIEKGAVQEHAHAFLTLEGRTAQAYLKGASGAVEQVYLPYAKTAPQRALLSMIADLTKQDVTKVMKMAEKEGDNLFRILAKNPALAPIIENGLLTPDNVSTMAKVLKDVPLNKEMFFAEAMGAIADHAMRQAIVQFGVKARGPFMRWMGAIKSAENLAFLRAGNFGYVIRNVLNNEATMIGRGVFGMFTGDQVSEFWKKAGFIPKRLADDLTLADAEQFAKGAETVLKDALRGGNYGAPEKITDFVQNLSLGKLDTGKVSRVFEKQARIRTMTVGYNEYWSNYYKPTPISKVIGSSEFEALRRADPDAARVLETAAKSARGSDALLDTIIKSNLHLNTQEVIDEASRIVGSKIEDLLEPETLAYIHRKLPDAIKAQKVPEFVLEVRNKIDTHIEDMFQKNLQNLVDDTSSRVQMGGQKEFVRTLQEVDDLYWGAHIEHTIRTSEAAQLAKNAQNAGDIARASSMWEQEFADAQKLFDRMGRRYDAFLKGMDDGVKELGKKGVKLPGLEEARVSFKEIRDGWKELFKFRNTQYRAFHSNKPGAKKIKWDVLQDELDTRYAAMADNEARLINQMDNSIASQITDDGVRQSYIRARQLAADLRRQDKQAVIELYKQLRDLGRDNRTRWINDFMRARQLRYDDMKQVDMAGHAVLAGDRNADEFLGVIEGVKSIPDTLPLDSMKVARSYGVYNQKHITNIVNKFLRGEYTGEVVEDAPAIAKLGEIDADLMKQALRARLVAGEGDVPKGMEMADFLRVTDEAPESAAGAIESRSFIVDTEVFAPRMQPIDLGFDQMTYGRSYTALDSIVDAAASQAKKTPLILDKLPPRLKDKAMQYISQIKDEMGSHRYAATRFAEFRSDSALLNYNRRTNFDAYAANIFPYVFWTTSSMAKWAIHSIDRPAMLSTYLRMKKFIETSGTQQDGLPSRTQGQVRINLPFAPDWMGDQFVDPLRLALPFDNFMQPLEQYQSYQARLEGRAERVLETMAAEGEITDREFQDAVDSQSGATWDLAVSRAQANDEDLKFDGWDFASLVSSPHAPIAWAYNLAMGNPENIGAFTPLSKTFRNVATVMGVDDWNNSEWNVEAKVRRQLGLPAFDKWDDYRIDRSLSNMATTGKYAYEDIERAMALSAALQSGEVTREQAMQDPAWDVYQEGVKLSNQEFTGGPVAAVLKFLGIPVNSYPEGEQAQRALQDDFAKAIQKDRAADASFDVFMKQNPGMSLEQAGEAWKKRYPTISKDADALNNFFEAHPEYEARLALFKSPEERLKTFAIDQIWSKWNEMPKVNRDEVAEQMGDTFNRAFLDKETRSYDDINSTQLKVWLKLMGGDPVGTLTADQEMLVEFHQLRLTDPETAYRAQVFYDTRNSAFQNWYEVQNGYYESPENKRSQYRAQHPELVQYWNWRRDFMEKNPDLVRFLTDDERALERAAQDKRIPDEAVPTANEILQNLSPSMQALLAQSQQGEELPYAVTHQLELLAESYGLTPEQMYDIAGVAP